MTAVSTMLTFIWVVLISGPTPTALENDYCLFLSKRGSARLLSKVNASAGNLVVVVSVTSFYSNIIFNCFQSFNSPSRDCDSPSDPDFQVSDGVIRIV